MRQRGFELFSYLPIRGLYHSVLYGGVHEMLKGLFVKKKDPIALEEKKKSLWDMRGDEHANVPVPRSDPTAHNNLISVWVE